jgi:hypothetical protein
LPCDETQRGVLEYHNFTQDPEFIEEKAKRGTRINGVPLNASNGSPCATLFVTVLFLPQLTETIQYQ